MSEPTEVQIVGALNDAAKYLRREAVKYGRAADRYHARGRDDIAAEQWLSERAYLAAAKRVVAATEGGEQ